MRTSHLVFVRCTANWKFLSFRVVEEKSELSVGADFRTGRIFHLLGAKINENFKLLAKFIDRFGPGPMQASHSTP